MDSFWSGSAAVAVFILFRLLSAWPARRTAPPPPVDVWPESIDASTRAAAAGRYEEALRHARQALDCVGDPPTDGNRQVVSLIRVASLELRLGRPEVAMFLIGRLQLLQEDGAFPLVSHAGSDLYEMLGELAQLRGRRALAETDYRTAIRIEEKIGGPRAPTLLNALTELARLLRDRGALEEARHTYARILALEFADPAAAVSARRDASLELAALHLQAGDTADAEPLLAEARILAHGDATAARARGHAELGQVEVLFRHGQIAEAEAGARTLIAWQRAQAESPVLLGSLDALARILARQGRFTEAQAVRGDMLKLCARFFGPDSPLLARQLEELADLSVQREDHDAALPHLERAARVVWQADATNHWRLPAVLQKQAAVIGRHGCHLQAEDYNRMADRLIDRLNARGRQN